MAAKKTTKKAAKKAATPTAKPAATSKAPAKKEAKPAAKKAAPKAKTAPSPSLDEIAQAAYLIYRRRIEQGLPGDSHSDWVEAEKQLTGGK